MRRKKYGLPAPKFDFHITIGRKYVAEVLYWTKNCMSSSNLNDKSDLTIKTIREICREAATRRSRIISLSFNRYIISIVPPAV
jgi:hypothetical protein